MDEAVTPRKSRRLIEGSAQHARDLVERVINWPRQTVVDRVALAVVRAGVRVLRRLLHLDVVDNPVADCRKRRDRRGRDRLVDALRNQLHVNQDSRAAGGRRRRSAVGGLAVPRGRPCLALRPTRPRLRDGRGTRGLRGGVAELIRHPLRCTQPRALRLRPRRSSFTIVDVRQPPALPAGVGAVDACALRPAVQVGRIHLVDWPRWLASAAYSMQTKIWRWSLEWSYVGRATS